MNAHNLKIGINVFNSMMSVGLNSIKLPMAYDIAVTDRIRFYEVVNGTYTGNCSPPFEVTNVQPVKNNRILPTECIVTFHAIKKKA